MGKIKELMEEKPIEPMQEYRYFDENRQHLHTYLDRPLLGTSSVVGVLEKNLVWWSAELSAVECLEAGEQIPTIREEYLAACASPDKKIAIDALQKKYPIFKKARFAHYTSKNNKAKEGTDLHAELEKYVKACMLAGHLRLPDPSFHERIHPFIDWCLVNVEKFLWSEVHCYSSMLWVGGISDCGVLLKNGKTGIIDFKSSKESYASQFIQCAGYDIELSENGGLTKEGYLLFQLDKPLDFYAIVPFGASTFKIDFRYNVEELKEGFKSTVVLYKILNQ